MTSQVTDCSWAAIMTICSAEQLGECSELCNASQKTRLEPGHFIRSYGEWNEKHILSTERVTGETAMHGKNYFRAE